MRQESEQRLSGKWRLFDVSSGRKPLGLRAEFNGLEVGGDSELVEAAEAACDVFGQL